MGKIRGEKEDEKRENVTSAEENGKRGTNRGKTQNLAILFRRGRLLFSSVPRCRKNWAGIKHEPDKGGENYLSTLQMGGMCCHKNRN